MPACRKSITLSPGCRGSKHAVKPAVAASWTPYPPLSTTLPLLNPTLFFDWMQVFSCQPEIFLRFQLVGTKRANKSLVGLRRSTGMCISHSAVSVQLFTLLLRFSRDGRFARGGGCGDSATPVQFDPFQRPLERCLCDRGVGQWNNLLRAHAVVRF